MYKPRMIDLKKAPPQEKGKPREPNRKWFWAQETHPVIIRPNGFHEDITFVRDPSILKDRDAPLNRNSFHFKGNRVVNLGQGVDPVSQMFDSVEADVPLQDLAIMDYGVIQSSIALPLQGVQDISLRCAFAFVNESDQNLKKFTAGYSCIGEGLSETFGLTIGDGLDVYREYDEGPDGKLIPLHVVTADTINHGVYIAKPAPVMAVIYEEPTEFNLGSKETPYMRAYENPVALHRQKEDGTFKPYMVIERYKFDALYQKVGDPSDSYDTALKIAKTVISEKRDKVIAERNRNITEIARQVFLRLRYFHVSRWHDPNPPKI